MVGSLDPFLAPRGSMIATAVAVGGQLLSGRRLLRTAGGPVITIRPQNMSGYFTETISHEIQPRNKQTSFFGGAGSRVVKSLGCGARGPGFESR